MTKDRRTRRQFDPEFKREAVRMWEERRAAGVSIGRVARELGLRSNQLREWAEQVSAPATGPALPVSAAGETLEQEVRRLRRENARLQEEAAFLKKAAAFFAKESQ